MCSNYRPVTSSQRLLTFFGVEAGPERRAGDVFPTGSAPFIRLTREGTEGGEPALLAPGGHPNSPTDGHPKLPHLS